jgi:galactokinase
MDNRVFLLLASYGSIFNEAPNYLVSAPGRVNLIGEHTDYNDGFVLPMAIERRIYVVARPMYGDLVRVKSVGFDGIEEFLIGDLISGKDTKSDTWSDYVKGVANEFVKAGHQMGGFWALFKGYIPVGSGLSSSAALEVASASLLAALFDHDVKPSELAVMARRAEEEFVGVRCGVMDQLTSLLAKEGHALFIDCRDLSVEHIPVKLPDATFLVVDTGVKRELGSSVYNERREECEAAAGAIQKSRSEVKALRDATTDDLKKIEGAVSETTIKRARHVITENERAKKAKEFLQGGDVGEFGKLMYQSHESLKSDYEVSSPELDLVVDTAKGADGVFGARMTGAGFGGSAIVLIKTKAVDIFSERMKAVFAEKEWEEPVVFPVSPSDGVTVEELEPQTPEDTPLKKRGE